MIASRQAFCATARELLSRIDLRFGNLRWRHHGLGMLQAELSEELRIHIWHPKLRTIPEDGYRDVHDHRFDLTSYVAFGEIIDTPVDVFFTDPYGNLGTDTTKAWSIVNAKAQERGEVHVKPLGAVSVRTSESVVYKGGASYSIARGRFHRTKVDGLALTLIHRGNFGEDQARVLGEIAHSAIVPEDVNTATLQAHVIYEADSALSDALARWKAK